MAILKLDNIDFKILRVLSDNGRITKAALAEKATAQFSHSPMPVKHRPDLPRDVSYSETSRCEQFEAQSNKPMARLALELMRATGASRQDACAMGRQNIKGDVFYSRRGKTGQETELPLAYMPNFVAEIVQLSPGTSVFLTHSKGRAYTVESFRNWFGDQCTAAGSPGKCRAHGLGKHGATELAEAGANEFQIMAFLAHKSTCEGLRYVRTAQRKKLAPDALALARTDKVSNLSDWLDKSNAQATESKAK